MSIQTARQTNKEESANPLDQLSSLLGEDMKNVNALIIDNMQSDVKMIPQLAGYLIAAGGKRIRPLLTLACTRLYNDNGPRAYGLAAAVEFIHTATLLHDDVVDKSAERRGKQAANLVFGNQASVLVGDFLFSRAFQLMVADGSLETLRILSDAAAIIAEGEVMQLTTANNLNTSMEDYLQVISAKTAALFAAACEIGPVIAEQDSEAQEAMRDFGLNLGIAFQIVDDVLDYSANQEKLGKTVGDDFREGKMTAPIIMALTKAGKEERAFWQRTIADKNQSSDDLTQAQTLFEKHDVFTDGMKMAHDYADKAQVCLHKAPDNDLRTMLDDTLSFTVERAY